MPREETFVDLRPRGVRGDLLSMSKVRGLLDGVSTLPARKFIRLYANSSPSSMICREDVVERRGAGGQRGYKGEMGGLGGCARCSEGYMAAGEGIAASGASQTLRLRAESEGADKEQRARVVVEWS
eukprot:417295-Pleurochrysis_carterae.AAC.1